MWLFTPRGFFSVVAHRDDPELVLVRARAHEDLRKLTGVLGQIDILETPDGDYRWRTTVTRRAWTGALVLQAAEIDYPNFKDEVARRQGYERASVYSDVWAILRRCRSAEPASPRPRPHHHAVIARPRHAHVDLVVA